MSGRIDAVAGPLPVVPAAHRATHEAPAKTGPAAKRSKDLAMAAREFEQIFVRAMLKTTPIAGKGDVYGDLAVDAMAKSVTAGRGLGLGELIRQSIDNQALSAAHAGAPTPKATAPLKVGR